MDFGEAEGQQGGWKKILSLIAASLMLRETIRPYSLGGGGDRSPKRVFLKFLHLIRTAKYLQH